MQTSCFWFYECRRLGPSSRISSERSGIADALESTQTPKDKKTMFRCRDEELYRHRPVVPVYPVVILISPRDDACSDDALPQIDPIDDIHASHDPPERRKVAFVVRLRCVSERVAGAAGIEAG
jgi:hypothetical protein